jgi:predicted nucleic acid-binding protein
MNMVVSDTSPLNYLVQLGRESLLPQIFSSIIIPAEVLTELIHARSPPSVQKWATRLPAWISIQTVTKPLSLPVDVGEVAAVSLAVEMAISDVLIDDGRARKIALGLGLNPIGTLRILEIAAERQLVEINYELDVLEKSNFRVHPNLVRQLREKFKR